MHLQLEVALRGDEGFNELDGWGMSYVDIENLLFTKNDVILEQVKGEVDSTFYGMRLLQIN